MFRPESHIVLRTNHCFIFVFSNLIQVFHGSGFANVFQRIRDEYAHAVRHPCSVPL